jgi:hypothetical protein
MVILSHDVPYSMISGSCRKNILFSTHFHATFAAGNRTIEGNGFRSLLFLTDMNTDQQIKTLENLVNEVIEKEEGYFLVEVRIKPTNNIKVFWMENQGSVLKNVFL